MPTPVNWNLPPEQPRAYHGDPGEPSYALPAAATGDYTSQSLFPEDEISEVATELAVRASMMMLSNLLTRTYSNVQRLAPLIAPRTALEKTYVKAWQTAHTEGWAERDPKELIDELIAELPDAPVSYPAGLTYPKTSLGSLSFIS